MFSKGATNTIQCDWINTRVDEAETEADNARAMPVDVVDLIEVWVEVERQHEDVVRKKAHRENNDEDEHRKCYLPPCANLNKIDIEFIKSSLVHTLMYLAKMA